MTYYCRCGYWTESFFDMGKHIIKKHPGMKTKIINEYSINPKVIGERKTVSEQFKRTSIRNIRKQRLKNVKHIKKEM